MKKLNLIWKTFATYLLVLPLLLVCVTCSAQVTAMQFNASWNEQNSVEWFNKLGDCDKESHMIDNNDLQKKYQIAVVPTIIIFDDGEEVKRFQADLSFAMQATRKEVQNYIDELIMSKF
jgi:hypothetical protein|tara:strand:- start:50 stop:406 length:357 start_codon:yes stop_codon:yes gene_type:complete